MKTFLSNDSRIEIDGYTTLSAEQRSSISIPLASFKIPQTNSFPLFKLKKFKSKFFIAFQAQTK